MKLGYNTWSMPTMTFEDAARLCASIGYDSLELTVCDGWPTDVMSAGPGQPARWRALADELGIAISSITGNTPLVCSEDIWQVSQERLERSLELAAEVQDPGQRLPVSLGAHKVKAPLLGGSPPPVVAQSSWAVDRQLIIDRFGLLAERATRLGVRVALEPHAGAVVSTPAQALDVLEQVGSDALGINLDISHFAVQRLPVADVVAQLLPHTLVCEVKDQRGVVPHFDFLIPGEGEFDYGPFLTALHAGGYQGSVAVEISVRRQATAGYDPVDAAQQSYQVLAKAFSEAGIDRPSRSDRERNGQ